MKRIGILFLLFTALLMMNGCGATFSGRYNSSTEIAPISFAEPQPNGIWQGKDLLISYTIKSYQPLFSLSGTLDLNSSILMSYPVVKSFFLRIHFLDAEGHFIGSSRVYTNFSYGNFADQESTISVSKEIPSQVAAFTFSYSGTFSDYGERFPDTTSIYYAPHH